MLGLFDVSHQSTGSPGSSASNRSHCAASNIISPRVVHMHWKREGAVCAVCVCVCVQVVIIAAGYDTRAYRLSKPGVRFYEVDLPHASQHKQDLVRKLLPASKVRPAGTEHFWVRYGVPGFVLEACVCHYCQLQAVHQPAASCLDKRLQQVGLDWIDWPCAGSCPAPCSSLARSTLLLTCRG